MFTNNSSQPAAGLQNTIAIHAYDKFLSRCRGWEQITLEFGLKTSLNGCVFKPF